MGKNLKRNSKAALVFLVSLFVCTLVTVSYVYNVRQLERTRMTQLVTTRANKVGDVIEKLLYKTQALAALVIQSDGEVRDFERIAATIVDDPAIRNVILAPDGVVSQVYPLEGNESVIGFDYFSESEGNVEAVQAKASGQLVLGGPFNLVQGGEALVGRLAIYTDNIRDDEHFWGIVSVTLNYPEALSGAELDQLKIQGYAYEIWRISPDTGKKQVIANSDYGYKKDAPYVEQKMNFLNTEWYFRLAPIRMWYEYPETWIFALGGFLVSLTLALLVLHNHDLQQMGRELENISYHDVLTGVLNRRGAFLALEKQVGEAKQGFVICFLDLDRFKKINDVYGHFAGDMALQHFAQTLRQQLQQKDVLARIGGDEFLVMLLEISSRKEAEDFLQNIEAKLEHSPLMLGGREVQLTCSGGVAVYPEDGTDVDALMRAADEKMYELKNIRKEL